MKDLKTESIVGKTIKAASLRGMKGYDDEPYIDIDFTDGTKITIVSSYGGYTGESEDEYPSYICIRERLKWKKRSQYKA